jgi:peptidoglycan/LPS O-acetylase OafA/YrhL
MLLLVPVHAASLLNANGSPGGWATAIYWTVHVFRLPLFFAMSGFFLALLLSRRGLQKTARNRTMRIVIPLVVGLVTIVPLFVIAAREVGVSISGDGAPQPGAPFALEPSFLWFLWYLLIVDCVAITTYLLAPAALGAAGRGLRAAIERPLIGICTLALVTTATLWSAPIWVQDPDTSTFVPEYSVLAYYALFFALGAMLHNSHELVQTVARDAWRWAAVAVAAAIPAGILFGFHNSALGSNRLVHLTALLIYAIATWTSLLALVGLATRYLNRSRPVLRYMADSSYWIYLSHLPAMVLAIALVGGAGLGIAPSFLLVTGAALAFSMVTYPLVVRHTPIGWVLNGPRERSRPPLWRKLSHRRSGADVIPRAAAGARRA